MQGFGNSGANDLFGSEQGNILFGRGGNDRLIGNAGADTLYGDSGDDQLWGGVGDDQLYGGSGKDRLQGDGGADLMDGGDGDDAYIVDSAGDGVAELRWRGTRHGWGFRFLSARRECREPRLVGRQRRSMERATMSPMKSSATMHRIGCPVLEGPIFSLETAATINLTGATATISSLVMPATTRFLAGSETTPCLVVLGTDTLEGGAGDDSLQGEAGNDEYRFGVGSGSDTLWEAGSVDDIDTIVLVGLVTRVGGVRSGRQRLLVHVARDRRPASNF